jgi:hypothetical protein
LGTVEKEKIIARAFWDGKSYWIFHRELLDVNTNIEA